jgi:hypothetical protein
MFVPASASTPPVAKLLNSALVTLLNILLAAFVVVPFVHHLIMALPLPVNSAELFVWKNKAQLL